MDVLTGDRSPSYTDVDAWLQPALDVLQQSRPGVSVLFLPWNELRAASLLPFHLHIRWAGRVSWLPLNAKQAFFPFLNEQLSELRIYPPLDAEKWRQKARAERHANGEQPNDLACPDWERAVARNRDDFRDLCLPGACYVAIDAAIASGGFRRGSRGVLGRRSQLVRPQVLTCSRGVLDDAQLSELRDVDLMVVDLQGASGAATLELTRTVLARRDNNKRTLLLAGSPSDLTPVSQLLSAKAQAFVIGPVPASPRLVVHEVGGDRALDDRSFDFATRMEPGAPPAAHFVCQQAKHAWWALRQRVAVGDRPAREYDGFLKVLALLKDSDPLAAQQFAHASELLTSAAQPQRAVERRRAIVAAALSAPGTGDTAVLTRDEPEAFGVRELLASELNVPIASLAELGIYVRPHYWRKRAYRAKNCVLCGYFGRRSVDSALRCHPSTLHLIADSAERRVAWLALNDHSVALRRVPGLETVADSLVPLLSELGCHTQAVGEARDVDLSAPSASHYSSDADERNPPRPPLGSSLIVFTDGTALVAPDGARFEVLGRVGGYLRTRCARDLERGDETIVLNDHSHARFSEFVLDTLDSGPLQAFVRKREQWMALVTAAVSVNHVTVATVLQRLGAAGHIVDRATVRAWISSADPADAAVPRTFAVFSALADALQLRLPDIVLGDLFSAVRRLRTVHRLAGRELARAIRFAHLGILDAPSQQRLKRTWGIEPSRLLDAARLATVDHVVR